MQTDYGTSSLSQWVMAEWIDSGFYEEHLIKFRKALVTRRNFVLDLLEKHFTKYATWNIPSGGYYVWLKLNIDVSSDKLFKEAIAQNILINPGNIYSFEQNSYVRLSYSYASLDQLEIGLRKLSEIIGKYAI